MILNGIPDNYIIHYVIPMYQDVSEPDNTVMLRNIFDGLLINFLNPVEGFSNNLKVPLDRSLRHRAILICTEIHPVSETPYLFRCL